MEALVSLANPSQTDADETRRLEEQLLSADERAGADRCASLSQRRDYLIARSLVRLTLSAYLPAVAPGDWAFGRDALGKPFVTAPAEAAGLQFSLSHTAGLTGVAVTSGGRIGLDIERIRATDDLPRVAERIFTQTEMASLRQLSGADWFTRFFQLWTLKEAYAKARSLGLQLRLQSVAFDLDSLPGVRATFDPDLDENPQQWRFIVHQFASAHILATAVRCEPQRPFPILKLLRARVRASPERAWLESLGADAEVLFEG